MLLLLVFVLDTACELWYSMPVNKLPSNICQIFC